MEQVLISCDPDAEAYALREIQEIQRGASPVWIEDGLALLVLPEGFAEFADDVRRLQPIFIRHIAPVMIEVPLAGEFADIEALSEAALSLSSKLKSELPFSVQSRILSEGTRPYRKITLNETLSCQITERTGATMDARRPEQVVSITCTPDKGYVGVSLVEENRSDWPGGEHRFKKEDGQISRAEFKLLEAIDVFGLTLPAQGRALDMGAAPGGWTRVLRAQGLNVVAVDPADLDRRLERDENVYHMRKKIEDFHPGPGGFDVLVNDMRMDIGKSVRAMRHQEPCLRAGGIGVMTLKLSNVLDRSNDWLRMVRKALATLTISFDVIDARQLYHNRSEVTVALAKRPEVL